MTKRCCQPTTNNKNTKKRPDALSVWASSSTESTDGAPAAVSFDWEDSSCSTTTTTNTATLKNAVDDRDVKTGRVSPTSVTTPFDTVDTVKSSDNVILSSTEPLSSSTTTLSITTTTATKKNNAVDDPNDDDDNDDDDDDDDEVQYYAVLSHVHDHQLVPIDPQRAPPLNCCTSSEPFVAPPLNCSDEVPKLVSNWSLLIRNVHLL
jgi:hypothetical protein